MPALLGALLAVEPATVITIVLVIGAIVVVILIIDGIYRFVQGLLTPTCSLNKSLIFRDKCQGTCPAPPNPAGSTCVAVTTKPYLFGLGGVQDATCACVAAAAPGGGGGGATGGGGTGAGTGGGSGGGGEGEGD